MRKGRELARQLQIHMNLESSPYETREFLVQKILASYEKALSIITQQPTATAAGTSSVALPMSESPPSLNLSPRSDQDSDRDQEFNRDNASRRRLAIHTKFLDLILMILKLIFIYIYIYMFLLSPGLFNLIQTFYLLFMPCLVGFFFIFSSAFSEKPFKKNYSLLVLIKKVFENLKHFF